jgi:sarcosine/dimethylglycine N-methyltransferase
LDDRVEVVHGNFEALPFDQNAFDAVVSQDAILHSGKRVRVLQEVARVLRPQGQFLFTDPMQSDDCPDRVLGPVLARIHLESLGSFHFYRTELARLGFQELGVHDLTRHLGLHYARVRKELEARYDEMSRKASKQYVDRMLTGLSHWVEAEMKGYLAWGLLHFRAP